MDLNLIEGMDAIYGEWRSGLERYRWFHEEALRSALLTRNQLTHIVTAMMAAEFQRAMFSCYELSVRVMLEPFVETDSDLAGAISNLLISDSALSSRNPTVANLGKDFKRVGILIWPELESYSAVDVKELKLALTKVIEIRNLVVHGRGDNEFAQYGEIDVEKEVFTPLNQLATLVVGLTSQKLVDEERRVHGQ